MMPIALPLLHVPATVWTMLAKLMHCIVVAACPSLWLNYACKANALFDLCSLGIISLTDTLGI